jgi:hypothetical protein
MTEPHEDAADVEIEQPRVRVRHRLPWIIGIAIALPALLFTLYTGLALHWTYSQGSRAGVLQKFSQKGWVCKTWEGELAMTTVPGVAPTLWEFSVRDAAAAAQVNALVGRRVMLHYREHRGVPTRCFGDTQYYVDSATALP